MGLKNKLATNAAIMTIALGAALASTAASARSAIDAYASSSYGWCDAKKIAAVWRIGIGQAKTTIGNKILARATNLLDQDINSRNGRRVRCSWGDTQLSYNDAVKLARHWRVQPHEAKQKAATEFTYAGTKGFFRSFGRVIGRYR